MAIHLDNFSSLVLSHPQLWSQRRSNKTKFPLKITQLYQLNTVRLFALLHLKHSKISQAATKSKYFNPNQLLLVKQTTSPLLMLTCSLWRRYLDKTYSGITSLPLPKSFKIRPVLPWNRITLTQTILKSLLKSYLWVTEARKILFLKRGTQLNQWTSRFFQRINLPSK